MNGYKILETHSFRKFFGKLPTQIKKEFEKKIIKTRENPYGIGKKLKSYKWFRELKNKGYRIYYVVYDNRYIVLFVGGSRKKDQQKMIDLIIADFEQITENIKKDECWKE
ncbi:hypothetical protein KY329_00110 [Candidatus Woesearchaeota archaeon]|nr:hypothetical protein [Candidatus Woesearchaeota archaeon]